MKIFLKILASIAIILIVAGVTCGGNLTLGGILSDSGSALPSMILIGLWPIEVIVISILIIKMVFFNKKTDIPTPDNSLSGASSEQNKS